MMRTVIPVRENRKSVVRERNMETVGAPESFGSTPLIEAAPDIAAMYWFPLTCWFPLTWWNRCRHQWGRRY